MNWTFEIPLCLSSDMNNKHTFAPTVSSVKGYVLYFFLFFFLNWYFWNILVWARMGQKLARCLERHMEPCSSCAALHWGLPTIIQVTLASLVDILTIFWAFCCFFYKKRKFISCKCTSFNSKIKFEKWMLRNRESVSLPPRSYIQNPTECEMNTVTASKAHKTLLVFVYLPTYLTLRRYFISIKDLLQNYFQFPVLVLFNSKRCSVLLLI